MFLERNNVTFQKKIETIDAIKFIVLTVINNIRVILHTLCLLLSYTINIYIIKEDIFSIYYSHSTCVFLENIFLVHAI